MKLLMLIALAPALWASSWFRHLRSSGVGTRAISQALWTSLPSYGLELVSHYLGLPFAHHAVEEDAVACATIVLRGCGEVGVADLTQLAERLMIRRGHLDPCKYTP